MPRRRVTDQIFSQDELTCIMGELGAMFFNYNVIRVLVVNAEEA